MRERACECMSFVEKAALPLHEELVLPARHAQHHQEYHRQILMRHWHGRNSAIRSACTHALVPHH